MATFVDTHEGPRNKSSSISDFLDREVVLIFTLLPMTTLWPMLTFWNDDAACSDGRARQFCHSTSQTELEAFEQGRMRQVAGRRDRRRLQSVGELDGRPSLVDSKSPSLGPM